MAEERIYDLIKGHPGAVGPAGRCNVGRVLPSGCCYFWGDGKHNYFTEEWRRIADRMRKEREALEARQKKKEEAVSGMLAALKDGQQD